MNISLIAAMSRNRAIGKDGKLPWPKHPADMRHFRRMTMGKVVIMGRRTYESLPGRLKGRINIVISADPLYRISDIFISDRNGFISVTSIDEALHFARLFNEGEETMIIGGGSVYRQFLPLASRIYLTIIDTVVSGDTYFPRYTPEDWKVEKIDIKYANMQNPYHLSFVELSKKPL